MSGRLAIIGLGRMGRAVDALAPEFGWEVVARVPAAVNQGGRGIDPPSLGGADVAVEFTVAAAAPANICRLVEAGCPVVVGTTGWNAEFEHVAAWVRRRGGALLAAPNFSIGVNLFERVAELASSLYGRVPGFDRHIVETHHAGKKDAPSGTALRLASAVHDASGGERDVPITSIRVGHVPGTHELIFDAAYEQVRLVHAARDRRVFAVGALLAARWLVGRRGIFTMQDVLFTPDGAL